MSYQVLARKWRPRNFAEMVGQEHVLKALINALDHKRLHHAYLFTGTRGVGKTTVARILAKCLNCESGISSQPCGVCSACVEITEGRFVDLIEVDAASRTKVEDTRDLLDNVQYSPTRGRYKIYLIDEVHMLSNSSFNALLKTLEEPPEHVKFLLATTDPQKLPVTVLSRCLQFHLKNMSPDRIVAHLQHVLERELVPFDEAALWALARAADGSMRDALSLSDQAIGYGNGKVAEQDVANMLGSIDQSHIVRILEALIAEDGGRLLQEVETLAEHAPDFAAALADLQSLLHRVALAQLLPDAVDNSFGDRTRVLEFAGASAPETLQLYYQIAIVGARDLPLASSPRAGFEMTLLRMLAFKPQGLIQIPERSLAKTPSAQERASEINTVESTDEKEPEVAQETKKSEAPAGAEPELSTNAVSDSAADIEVEEVARANDRGEIEKKIDWPAFLPTLELRGILLNRVANLYLSNTENDVWYFILDAEAEVLFESEDSVRLQDALSTALGRPVRVELRVDTLASDCETPARRALRLKREKREQALQKFREDPVVQNLQKNFAASLDENSLTFIE